MAKAVEFVNINKRFPGVHVLKDISFSVEEGEVHALLGENGAGKSTLLNILHGVYPEYEGEVRLHGEKVSFKDTNDAIVNGRISKVHQETLVVKDLTVGQNVTMGYEPKKGIFIDFKKMNKLADECGKATDSVSDFAINEQNGELAVTEVIQFEDRKVNITSTFEESDNGYIMTSLSFDPIYSMGEKMEQAALNTVMGMGTVFAVLIFISAIISLFKFIPSIIDSFGKNKKSEENKETATESKASVPVVEQPVSDDAELIAVIAAAIAASENTTTDGFVVRSIRKR